jgi:hypothetical protein
MMLFLNNRSNINENFSVFWVEYGFKPFCTNFVLRVHKGNVVSIALSTCSLALLRILSLNISLCDNQEHEIWHKQKYT